MGARLVADGTMTVLKPKPSEAVKFLQKLGPGGPWVLTAIVPDGPTTTITARTADEISDFIRDYSKQLRAAGTRQFLFQQGRSGPAERAFRILAEVTGGAYFPFNPHIERVAERLPGMLEAITHFVIGGMAALEARDNESAVLLFEQTNAAGQIAQDTPQAHETKV
jgi:hypothetical protein